MKKNVEFRITNVEFRLKRT